MLGAREVQKARMVVATALTEPCSEALWARTLARLPGDAALWALAERVMAGTTEPWLIERLMGALAATGLADHGAWLASVSGDGALPLEARGLAFEVYAQRYDQLGFLRAVGEVEVGGDGTGHEWLEAFLAGVALRGDQPDTVRRFIGYLHWSGHEDELLERLDRTRRAMGVPAARCYRRMILEPDLEWGRARMLAWLLEERDEGTAALLAALKAEATDRKARKAIEAARSRLEGPVEGEA